jgi:CheY-like chemotaxis protein
MLVATQQLGQNAKPLRVAIVEDNATARANLRSNLIGLEHFDVASFSNGGELRNGLRKNDFDLILMDFHLGQSKNGVEWIHSLLERELFKPSMGLVFVTSDGMPQTIGQILDLYPDFILIKPYTIKNLKVSLGHYVKLRIEILPILQCMNQNNNLQALKLISNKIKHNHNRRFANDFLKLKGRLLLAEKQYPLATELYSEVLKKSSNVLWAHWGLIKSEFYTGQWEQCQAMLENLVAHSLTKDKAYEWLASVALGKQEFNQAQVILDNIKESELTIGATRLKVLALKMQKKHEDAQVLLEKKIQNNLTVKDRMSEYALELARFHIQMAESFVFDNLHIKEKLIQQQAKHISLKAARKLIGKARRSVNDRHSELQKDCMLALAYIVEGDNERAQKMMEKLGAVDHTPNLTIATMIDAAKVWFGIGQTEKANEILQECDDYLLYKSNHIDRFVCADIITGIEKTYHLEKERALHSNEKGTLLYREKEYIKALSYFYKAYKLFPSIPAFSLNLLQCMAETDHQEFQGVYAKSIFNELLCVSLSASNQIKLEHVKAKFAF